MLLPECAVFKCSSGHIYREMDKGGREQKLTKRTSVMFRKMYFVTALFGFYIHTGEISLLT